MESRHNFASRHYQSALAKRDMHQASSIYRSHEKIQIWVSICPVGEIEASFEKMPIQSQQIPLNDMDENGSRQHRGWFLGEAIVGTSRGHRSAHACKQNKLYKNSAGVLTRVGRVENTIESVMRGERNGVG